MDVKIEPDDAISPPDTPDNTLYSDYHEDCAENLWDQVPPTDHRQKVQCKKEQSEDDVYQVNKETDSLNDQNNEECSKVKSEKDDMRWENCKDDVHTVKIEAFDAGECAYAETTSGQCIPINFETSIKDTPALIETCSENETPEQEQVAIVILEKAVFHEQNFVCNHCYDIFASINLLKIHKPVHSNEYERSNQEIPIEYDETNCIVKPVKRFKCDECDYSSAHSYSLKTHRMIHTGEKPFNCDQCLYKTAYSFHLKSHKMSHSNEKTLKCDKCDFTSAHVNSLKRHKIIHSSIKPFKCDQCVYKATSSFLLRKHKTSHSDEKPFKCDSCDFTCANSSNLKRHNMIHSGEKPFKCDQCEFKTIYSFHFKMHKLLHTGQKPYRCEGCDYKTIHPTYLKAHKSSHNCVKAPKCDQKDTGSSGRVVKEKVLEDGALQNTNKSKSNVVKVEPSVGLSSSNSTPIPPPIDSTKPFKCNQCEYKSSKSADLKRHEKVHSSERPWKCDLCDYTSAHSSNLKTHRMVHSGEKPFKCDQCEFRSVRSSDLKRHKMLHSGEKPHHCDTCMYKTAYLTDLKKHKLTHSRPSDRNLKFNKRYNRHLNS